MSGNDMTLRKLTFKMSVDMCCENVWDFRGFVLKFVVRTGLRR